MKVWITTYWTTEIEPVVTPFDNRKAAETCARYYRRQGYKVCVDECNFFHKFIEQAESEDNEMTKEQKDKILKVLVDDRNNYARDCNMRIAEENGKITGADYMLQRFLDILSTEVEPQENEE